MTGVIRRLLDDSLNAARYISDKIVRPILKEHGTGSRRDWFSCKNAYQQRKIVGEFSKLRCLLRSDGLSIGLIYPKSVPKIETFSFTEGQALADRLCGASKALSSSCGHVQ
jgi:hypothetical protein